MTLDYISLDRCIDGHLYVLCARNASIGIFDADGSYFHICREKGGKRIAAIELHADIISSTSTAYPLLDIGIAPCFQEPKELVKYLDTHPMLSKARMFRRAAVEKDLEYPLPLYTQIP